MLFLNKPHRYKELEAFYGTFDSTEFAVYAESAQEAKQIATEYFKIKKRDKDKLRISNGYSTPSERVG